MQAGIFLVDVVDIVGGDKFQIVAVAKVHQPLVGLGQALDIMRLKLDEEPVPAKDIQIPLKFLLGPLQVIVMERAGDLAGETAGCDDQAFAVFGEEVVINPGTIVEAFELGS